MSDYDDLREDEYERRLEKSNEARDVAIEFHADNWLTAVTQSVEKSNGTFPDVSEYVGKNFNFERVYRPANSVDVFVEELNNLDFMERAAKILIDTYTGEDVLAIDVAQLFADMAANYADYKYENNRED